MAGALSLYFALGKVLWMLGTLHALSRLLSGGRRVADSLRVIVAGVIKSCDTFDSGILDGALFVFLVQNSRCRNSMDEHCMET